MVEIKTDMEIIKDMVSSLIMPPDKLTLHATSIISALEYNLRKMDSPISACYFSYESTFTLGEPNEKDDYYEVDAELFNATFGKSHGIIIFKWCHITTEKCSKNLFDKVKNYLMIHDIQINLDAVYKEKMEFSSEYNSAKIRLEQELWNYAKDMSEEIFPCFQLKDVIF